MNILLEGLGQGQINDRFHIGNIQATSGHIGGEKNVHLRFFEIIQSSEALNEPQKLATLD